MAEQTKADRRAAILAARRTLGEDVRSTESALLIGHLPDAVRGAAMVCAYWPTGTEPGSPQLVERLATLCSTVLLPVVDGADEPLRWGEYRPGELTDGPFGLREPAGPSRGVDAIADADVVLVPALAVDRRGVRLGRGGGFYDRSLALCPPGRRLVAVVRDDELVEELPREPHDVLMTHALTPRQGLVELASGMAD